ncbi:MAG: M23 family metallopeptidase [Gammaproteobacteria bacterium]|nr:M23 family metallopeptidase [Gammaproteobacteria bacterium]
MRFLIASLALSLLASITACNSGDSRADPGSDPENPGGSAVDFGNTLVAPGTWPISASSTPDCIQDGFGHRELGGKDDFHPGVDTCDDNPTDVDAIAGNDNDDESGFPIHAIADGVISKVRTWDPRWDVDPSACPSFCRQGNYLLVEHPVLSDAFGGTVQTLYMHLSQGSMGFSEADVGSAITRGTVLGHVGRSGQGINTTHLHFGLLVGSHAGQQNRENFANPLHLLPYPKSSAAAVVLSRETDASVFDTGECPASESANDFPVLRVALSMESPALDLGRLEVTPSGSDETIVVDLVERIGVGSGNVDDFQQGCVAVEVEPFNESIQTYNIAFLLGGNWDRQTAFDVTVIDIRGNAVRQALSSGN